MTTLTVASLSIDSPLAADAFANRAASCMSGSPYIHCELILPGGEALSILANGNVFLTPAKRFSRSDWSFMRTTIGETERRALYAWACAQQGKPFNKVGYYTQPVMGWSGGGDSYFCSELCTKGLQMAGVMRQDVRPHTLSPGSLHAMLHDDHKFVATAHPKKVDAPLAM